MPAKQTAADLRPEFNLTAASTLHHVIGAGIACAGIWALIAATIGV
ncbi:MAG: hypothetical protein ACPGOY_05295 [Rhodospirillaceae bacterium]